MERILIMKKLIKAYLEEKANAFNTYYGFNLQYRIKVKPSSSNKTFGYYESKLGKDMKEYHNIKISTVLNMTAKAIEETILHELIHAWQLENKEEVGHGLSFHNWVKYFESIGYNVD
jgi:hypothetical protein